MTDLTTMHLKCLLEQATPGPWEYDPGEQEDERCIIDTETWNMCINPTPNGAGSSCSDYDLELAAHAPALARELIRLRGEIKGLITAMEDKAAIGESQSPAVIAGFLKEVVLREVNE